MSLTEQMIVLTIAAILIAAGADAIAPHLRARRLADAARSLALDMQRARGEAIGAGRSFGILFSRDPDGWSLHRDGGEEGIRSAECRSGLDPVVRAGAPIASLHPGVRFGFHAPGLPRIPPQSGRLTGEDPIALGPSDVFSASPGGTTTTGTVYLTDGRETRAVVAYGPTGRLRIWRHDPLSNRWVESHAGSSR